MSLLDEPPLGLQVARRRLAELNRRARHRLECTLAVAALGVVVLALYGGGSPGVPLLVGAGAGALLTLNARDDRGRLLVRLVAQGDAWAIEEVRSAARRLASSKERGRLSRGLALAADAGRPGPQDFAIVRPERAFSVADRLRRLATAIGDPGIPVPASAIALCRRLLSESFLSPLYNPHLSERDLDRILLAIERDIGRQRAA
jgi:hypothetical protein